MFGWLANLSPITWFLIAVGVVGSFVAFIVWMESGE